MSGMPKPTIHPTLLVPWMMPVLMQPVMAGH